MVPVLSENNLPLFPCKERRARSLMAKGEAKVYWQKGIFCIKLVRKESNQREEYPEIILGLDPGSKREGYTVACEKGVVLNLTTNTKNWVKNHLESRRILRRTRRRRNTPYRAQRLNRATLKKSKIPPSTKVRWDTKLQMIKYLSSIIPINQINIEDIKAQSLPGKKKWNKSFSPLQSGKKYFDEQVQLKFPKVVLSKTLGFDTKKHRDKNNYIKSKKKLDYAWEAHNVDSHSLCEITLGKNIKVFKGLYKIEFLEYFRRQLHVQNPLKGNFRKKFGGTVSLGMSRGSFLVYKNKNIYFLGGTSSNRVTLLSPLSGKRVNRMAKISDIKILYTNNKICNFVNH